MKRFLTASSTCSAAATNDKAKTARLAAEVPRGNPKIVVTWNANGLANRIKAQHTDWKDFTSFIRNKQPDVVCIQEVKLAAEAPPGRSSISSSLVSSCLVYI
eukprot:Platyproteum_vivax@DN11554_c0_g1_i1.p1